MAKKPTEKQLYKLKNEWLGQFFEEVKPKEFYAAETFLSFATGMIYWD